MKYFQFDCIDFSDNEIKRLDGFPLLSRLSMLLFNNNKICRISEDLYASVPNIETLVLTGNILEELSDLNGLNKLSKLKYLSLMRNPVTTKPKYRLFVIHHCPSVRVLDYKRIKQQERNAAKKIFGSKTAEEAPEKAKTFVPGEPVKKVQTAQDKEAIRAAIAKASSLDEIRRLELMLSSGSIPGFWIKVAKNSKFVLSFIIFASYLTFFICRIELEEVIFYWETKFDVWDWISDLILTWTCYIWF